MDIGKILGGLADLDDDAVREAVDLLTHNKANLERLRRLPELIDRLAGGLDDAGGQARAAATALVGDDGEAGVRGTLGDCATALADIAKALGAGIDKLADAADGVARVPLMDGPAGRLKDAAADLGATTDRVVDLSKGLGVVADALGTVGTALQGLGDHLGDTGGQARGFLDAPEQA